MRIPRDSYMECRNCEKEDLSKDDMLKEGEYIIDGEEKYIGKHTYCSIKCAEEFYQKYCK